MKVFYVFLNGFSIIAGVIIFCFGVCAGFSLGDWTWLGISPAMIIGIPILLRIVFALLSSDGLLLHNVVEITRKPDRLK